MHTVFFCIPEAWLCTSTNQSAFLHFRKHKKSFQPGRFKAKSILIFYSQNWYFTTKVMILWNWWKVIPYWKPIEEKATHSRLGNYDDSSSSRNLLRVFFSLVLRLVRQKSLLYNGLKLFSKCKYILIFIHLLVCLFVRRGSAIMTTLLPRATCWECFFFFNPEA